MASAVLSNAAALKLAVATIGQGTPPVQLIEETGEMIIRGEETDKFVTTQANNHLVEILAFSGLVSGILSFFFVVGRLVDFMSICVVVLAPMVAVQKHRLRKLGGFRGQHNSLRLKVNQLHSENDKLTQSVTALTAQTSKLQQVEQDVKKVAEASGQSVDKLVAVVEENVKIQKEIFENLQADVLQQIMTVVLQTDNDHNFIVSSTEVGALILRLQSLPGLTFDEKVFRSCLKSDVGELTLTDVCDIARHLRGGTQTMIAVNKKTRIRGSSSSKIKRLLKHKRG